MADKQAPALKLESAKEELEQSIGDALASRPGSAGEPSEINVGFGDNPEAGGTDEGNEEIVDTIRTLVDDFHQQAIVQQTGVRVRRVTAIDSDADGQSAVDVEYDYSS